MSEPMNFPPHLEKLVRTTVNDGMASIAERAMLREITDLRSRLADAERERDEARGCVPDAFTHVLASERAAHDTITTLKESVAELAGALRKAHNWMCRLGCPSAPPGVFYEWTGDREEIAAVLAKHATPACPDCKGKAE